MHISVLCLVFIDKISLLFKRYFYIIIPIVVSIIYIAKHYQPEKSRILEYLSLEKLPELYHIIMGEGAVLLSGYNRAFASINELMYFILYLGVLFIILSTLGIRYKQKDIDLHIRVILFIMLTSLFVLIPLYQFSGGLFGVITKTHSSK